MTDAEIQTASHEHGDADEIRMTLVELSLAHAVPVDRIVELVQEGVLEPSGRAHDEWRFTELHFHHAGVAVRLQRDLGINLSGVALALQLLEEIQTLRQRLASTTRDMP